MHLNIRAITQFLVGLMLLFAAISLIPRAIILLKLKIYSRSILFFFLGGLSLFLAIAAFAMAFFG